MSGKPSDGLELVHAGERLVLKSDRAVSILRIAALLDEASARIGSLPSVLQRALGHNPMFYVPDARKPEDFDRAFVAALQDEVRRGTQR